MRTPPKALWFRRSPSQDCELYRTRIRTSRDDFAYEGNTVAIQCGAGAGEHVRMPAAEENTIGCDGRRLAAIGGL